MRRLSGWLSGFISSYVSSVVERRLWALFLLLVFLVGCVTPIASTVTAMSTPQGSQPLVANDYPEPIPYDALDEMLKSDKVPERLKERFQQGRKEQEPSKTLTKKANQEPLQSIEGPRKTQQHEAVDQRTATSSLFVNEDGSLTKKEYFTPKHFKKNGSWVTIDTTLVEDKNAADSSNIFGKALGTVKSWVTDETTYIVKDNDWHARFAPSNDGAGMLRVKKGSSQVGFKPMNAKDVSPVVSNLKDGTQAVWYYDLWEGVDVQYIVESAAVKENIVIKNKLVPNKFSFEVTGGQLQKVEAGDKSAPAYRVKGALGDSFSINPANLMLNNFGLVTEDVLTQDYEDGVIRVSIKNNYLQGLPDKAFPAVLDPTITSTFGTRQGGNYVSFKTDNTICYSNICNLYAGSLYDSNNQLQWWRGAYFAPYDQFRNSANILTDARLHLTQRSNESFWTGTWTAHNFQAGHATCLNNFTCVDGIWGDATFAGSGDINLTNLYQSRINANDFGAWIMVMGEDNTTSSFKNFDPNNSYVVFTYGGPPPAPSIATPIANQIYVDSQPSFKVNYVSNPNGSTPLQYEMLVSSAPGAAGTLVTSGKLHAQVWTVPSDVLQDGSTYYLQARTYDPITGSYSSWSGSVPFKIDMRTGKDQTQSYDSFGPVDVNLATGDFTTGISSHTTAALGGDIGIGLTYNTHTKSTLGLDASYWWLPSNFSGDWDTIFWWAPDAKRVDQTVDFSWGSGSPSSAITEDWFAARWHGYFIAPKSGEYYFGGAHDDSLEISMYPYDTVYSSGYCSPGPCYGSAVDLTEGELVEIDIRFRENTGNATARVFVKGAVDEQILPESWLRTEPKSHGTEDGLTGRYYARQDGTNNFSTGNPLVMQRTDRLLNFNWGSGAPVSGGPTDFLVRWTGYITAPISGTYEFGTVSDDGSKIILGTNNTVVYNDWTAHSPVEGYGAGYWLDANQPVPITIEYFDSGGGASFQFKVRGEVPTQIVPTNWLSTKAEVLPEGWTLNVSPDGDVNYNYLTISQNSVTLRDSAGASHEYTWTGSGYKPPVNEDGYLVRNSDGTFTLYDTDGKTYVFNNSGTISSVTLPVDDRNPAALKYEYQSLNGGPVHLYRIVDGVNTGRNGTLYYSGQSQCGSAPSGFDAQAPAGMLCAFKTNDGRATYFYYEGGLLARVALPGNQNTDYGYQQSWYDEIHDVIHYELSIVRDSLANDALAAGVRTNPYDTSTVISTDYINRVDAIWGPSPEENQLGQYHLIDRYPGAVDKSYSGRTDVHIGSFWSEPNGFSRRITYDNLYRTITETDMTNLTKMTEWDPQKDLLLSATTPDGLKSSTFYDDEDRPVENYGPVPKEWFGSDRKPLPAYASQAPRADTSYDEAIVGLAVAWHDYTRQSGSPSGTLFSAPKLHTTGINTASPGVLNYAFTSPPINASSSTNVPDIQGIGLSGTGKLRLPNGTYTISATTTDGIRILVDDKIVLDSWIDAASRSVTSQAFTISDASPKRFRVDIYRKTGSTGTLDIKIQQQGGFAATNNWTQYLKPDYSLVTKTKTYDSTIGDTINVVNYGSTPELGLPATSTLDPSGLNLSTIVGYETQGASGSFLRPISKRLPGNTAANPTFQYAYYPATNTRDNPCTTPVEAYKQAGFLKFKTEADPDGAGSQVARKSELVYDDAGRIVATRFNSEPWTCTSYDSRGRVAQTIVPTISGRAGRTVTYNYAVNGNPLVRSTSDTATGVTTVETDAIGRIIESTDTFGYQTEIRYNALNQIEYRSSLGSSESISYDEYARPSSYSRYEQQTWNGVYAEIFYDSFNRVSNIQYYSYFTGESIFSLDQIKRDAIQRTAGATYSFSDGSTYDETVTRAPQKGTVTGDTIVYNGHTASSVYQYDNVGRLTDATVDNWLYHYNFGAQDASCTSLPGYNANANKNSNRVSTTITNALTNASTTTKNCYNFADQLITSTDGQIGTPTYDSHGNIAQLNGGGTPIVFGYNASDQNISITQGNNKVEYIKGIDGKVLVKKEYRNGVLDKVYRNAGGTLLTCDTTNQTQCTVTDHYAVLPGGVALTLTGMAASETTVTYSIQNFHGDTAITLDGNGVPTGSVRMYDPFGQPVASNTFGTSGTPSNASDNGMGWATNPARKQESMFSLAVMQMGARVYIPALGRFLQIDPIDGGVLNAYVYVADPINLNDYTGLCAYIIQCTATVAYFQPAATVSQVQPTLSSTKTQGPGSLRSSSGRTSPRVQNRPSVLQRMGSGKVENVRDTVSNAWNNGYINLNVGYGRPIWIIPTGINGGLKISKQGVHGYIGGCLMNPGGSASVTSSASPASTGWSGDLSYFTPRYVGGGVSTDGSVELGVGARGGSVCANYTW